MAIGNIATGIDIARFHALVNHCAIGDEATENTRNRTFHRRVAYVTYGIALIDEIANGGSGAKYTISRGTEHPLSGKARLLYEMLISYPYLSYEQGAHKDSWFKEEMISGEFASKHIVISDRATLMNVLLKTDAYTVGTGIMPSALNEGKIISVPLESNSHYSVGYITRDDRILTPILEKFISVITEFGNTVSKVNNE